MQENGATKSKLVQWTPRDDAEPKMRSLRKNHESCWEIRIGGLHGKQTSACKAAMPPRMQRQTANTVGENPTKKICQEIQMKNLGDRSRNNKNRKSLIL